MSQAKYSVVNHRIEDELEEQRDEVPKQPSKARSQISSSNFNLRKELVADYKPDFWRSKRIRNGTWLLIFGCICFVISIVLTAVFWRWWWSPSLNYPFRIFGITFGVLGLVFCIIGSLSNYIMINSRTAKHFIGSPIRIWSWLMFVGVFFIVVSSNCIAIYYIYWHNRFVNTPLIITGIILEFFGILFLIIGLVKDYKAYKKHLMA